MRASMVMSALVEGKAWRAGDGKWNWLVGAVGECGEPECLRGKVALCGSAGERNGGDANRGKI